MNIPIFLASDDNFSPFVATSITSICINTNSIIDFYILDSGICDVNKTKISDMATKFGNCTLEFIKIAPGRLQNFRQYSQHITLATYNRFFIPYIKPKISQAIYLDVDVIAMGDIEELWSIGSVGTLGAVWEEFFQKSENKLRRAYLDCSENHLFFNAGVLLINCNYWRDEDVFSKLLSINTRYSNASSIVDEDILNKCFDNNYDRIPDRFNLMNGTILNNRNNNIQVIQDADIIIRHYEGVLKPWNSEKAACGITDHYNLFWDYAKLTPYYDMLRSGFIVKRDELKRQLEICRKDNIKKRFNSLRMNVINSQHNIRS
jgi:lipopolysaccharide biosynthesis glycosyltransferase